MLDELLEILRDPNAQWILLGCMLLGLSSGIIGCFAYLRKQSLMGDTLAHAALPGICIAFMLTGTKSIMLFLIGAGLAGLVATLGISWITKYSKLKTDAAMGIVLTGFFGIGIVLLTQIQHSGSGSQSGLDKFLFGQAASMVSSDVATMLVVSLFLSGSCWLLFKELKLVSFDPGFARGLGFPVAFLEQLLMFFMVIAVVVGIQAVGVVLVAALLITPAVSARYWTDRLGMMMVLSGIFGALSGALGTLLSAAAPNMPTGPLTVLAATLLFSVSLLAGPRKGLIARRVQHLRAKREHLAARERQAVPAPSRGVSQ
ncbi:metal ABC transporter permease [Paenibacillus sambharensis]|uniref:Manganese transport system membrane protein MntC n=1 Tax=Paenibacillus sambharensis TaxID=1803190 RepID=A0A2W1LHH7_9BACL|nr:metal ABC transporter permease [Paenibacillus sambharensis]PZD94502.1 metal ABC transporter permease [Paenibacillus sambharensis]